MWPNSIRIFFFKFNTIIFITVIVGLLAFCVLFTNQTLSQTTGSDINNSGISPNQTSFDSSTKSNLLNLKNSTENQTDVKLPSGRINPFWDFTE